MSSSKPAWFQRELPAFFRRWRTDWKDEELSPANYLDFEGGLRFVLAAAWLFCPETVEYRGCVFLKERFGQGAIDDWFTKLGGDRQRIEAVANHVELWAFFGNTPLTDDDQLGEELPQLALALGECWQGVLSARYPDREITVEVSDEEDGSYGPTVTFWTSPAISAQVLSAWEHPLRDEPADQRGQGPADQRPGRRREGRRRQRGAGLDSGLEAVAQARFGAAATWLPRALRLPSRAVADSDEWDDKTYDAGQFDSTLIGPTCAVPVAPACSECCARVTPDP